MKDTDISRYNEIFLNDISGFDCYKYAYQTFFDCDKERFSKISSAYRRKYGVAPWNYMMGIYQSWQRGYVSPNINSSEKIVSATLSTFTADEKFVFSFSSLAVDIKNKFPKHSVLSELNVVLERLIETIDKFELVKSSRYASRIFEHGEAKRYEELVKGIFRFYSNIIFSSLVKDLELIYYLNSSINSEFLELDYRTYLFNIQIDVKNISMGALKELRIIKWEYDSLDYLSSLIIDSPYSIEGVLALENSYRITLMDASLSRDLVEDIDRESRRYRGLGFGGSMKYTLRANSGILKISYRILSNTQKALLLFRVFLFFVLTFILFYALVSFQYDFFVILVYLVISWLLICPCHEEITKLIKDILVRKKWKKTN